MLVFLSYLHILGHSETFHTILQARPRWLRHSHFDKPSWQSNVLYQFTSSSPLRNIFPLTFIFGASRLDGSLVIDKVRCAYPVPGSTRDGVGMVEVSDASIWGRNMHQSRMTFPFSVKPWTCWIQTYGMSFVCIYGDVLVPKGNPWCQRFLGKVAVPRTD